MIHIIPSVKKLEIKDGYLGKKAIFYNKGFGDSRLKAAVSKLPYDESGTELDVEIAGDIGEEYELWIHEASIDIKASSTAGAFYAIQTLRQRFNYM